MSEWFEAIDAVVEDLLREAGIDRPPVDAELLAERLQVQVFEQEGMAVRGMLVGGSEGTTIVVRSELRDERTQYSVAHELGELKAREICRRVGEPPEFVSAERFEEVSNRFAERLLCPERWFRRAAQEGDFNLADLKETFTTASHEVIALRMLHADVPTVITVFDNGRIARRTSNLQQAPPLAELERRARQSVSSTGRATALQDAALCVQGWPVWEPGWRREILRTTALDE